MEKIKNNLKSFIESNKFNVFVYGFFFAFVAMIIFQAGVFVGFHKANFSYKWGNNYQKFFEMRGRDGGKMDGFEQIFDGPRGKMEGDRGDFFGEMPIFPPKELMGAHGVTGKIIDIKLPSIIISDLNNVEKAVLIDSSTIIRQFRDNIKPEDLKINDTVVIIGSPNENTEIVAKMIRIIPVDAIEIIKATSTNQ